MTQAASTTVGRPVEIEESLERLSWLLDDLFRIPGLGWRVGLDALVGLIPGVGDTATTVASLYVLASAVRYRVPKITLLRMGLNLGIDYALGSLPLVGDLFDAWWKSNQKNVDLLRQRATVSASEAREGRISDWLFVGLIMILLVALAVGAALISIYLLATAAEQSFHAYCGKLKHFGALRPQPACCEYAIKRCFQKIQPSSLPQQSFVVFLPHQKDNRPEHIPDRSETRRAVCARCRLRRVQ